jgi:hypothetical protein
MKTAEELSKTINSFYRYHGIEDGKAKDKSFEVISDFEKEIKSDLNEFIGDIAKLLGEDDLGHDGKSWSIDDFKDAIEEVRKEHY